MAEVAIIGGSGFYQPGIFSEAKEFAVETPYGVVQPVIGKVGVLEAAFIPRHGREHSFLPHQLNYRANIWALKELGVKRIIATSAVGSLNRRFKPGTLVIIDQFLDFTKKRPLTFFENGDPCRAHIDMTEPYCPALREHLKKAAGACKIPVRMGGCYVCTEGPRYETAAEIRMFQELGGDVVGMTGVPEVTLARELGICYAGISMVTNWAAGISKVALIHEEVAAVMRENQEKLRQLLAKCLMELLNGSNPFKCRCGPRKEGR